MKRGDMNRNHFLSFIGLGFFILLAFASADDKALDNEKQEKNSSSTTTIQTQKSSPKEVTREYVYIGQKTLFQDEQYWVPSGEIWKVKQYGSALGFIIFYSNRKVTLKYDFDSRKYYIAEGDQNYTEEFESGTEIRFMGLQSNGYAFIKVDIYGSI